MIQFRGSASALSFRGIIPPVVTPLLAQDTLDVQGLDRLIEHLIAGGVHGLHLLGCCGEGPSLSFRLRSEVVTRACERVRGRVPVLIGITDSAFSESIALAEIAHEARASAVVLSAPYYFAPSQAELVSYVRHLHDELPLPLVLYNQPDLTGVWFEPQSLEQLIDLPKLIGIKDSSADMNYFEEVIKIAQRRPKIWVLVGPEHLLVESMQLGGAGGVAGGANLFPQLFVGLFDALASGDRPRSEEYQSIVDQLQSIYRVGQSHSAVVKALKTGLAYLNVCGDLAAEPFQPFEEAENAAIASILEGVESQLNHTRQALNFA